MPSGKSSKTVRNARPVVTATKPKPWGTIAAAVAVTVFAVAIFGYMFTRYEDRRAFIPTASTKDPSTRIPGILIQDYGAGRGHIGPDKRVAYDHSPPFGGPHDGTWAACNGVVYAKPVRNENMVHALEHGAVWIAYNPDKITGAALQSLRDRVQGANYLMLSPYPGLDKPISLQAWGFQLKVDKASDKRIDDFVKDLRENASQEPGTPCSSGNYTTKTGPDPVNLGQSSNPSGSMGAVAPTASAAG